MHKWTDTITKEPTYTEEGERKLICDGYGDIRTEKILSQDSGCNLTKSGTGTEVSVKHFATLNDGAEFKNVNNAYLEYINNPNGNGIGATVSDDVTAFTFIVDIDKVDKDGNALDGARFTLYKKAMNGEEKHRGRLCENPRRN